MTDLSPATAAIAGLALVGLAIGLGLVPHQGYVREGSFAFGAMVGLCLLAALAYLAWQTEPAWLITGAVVLWPFNSSWGDFGFPRFIAPDRMLLVAGFAALVLRAPAARDRRPIIGTPIHILFAATVAWTAGSAIAVGTLGQSTSIFLIIDRMVVPFVVFVLAPAAFPTARHRSILLAGLVAGGLYCSLTTLFESIGLNALVFPRFILDPHVGYHLRLESVQRARGPFLEAGVNGLGLYVYGVAAAIACSRWRGWARAVAVAVMVLSALGILLTLTRAAWLAAVVATIVTLITVRSLRRFLVPTLAVGAALVAIALTTVPSLSQHVSERRAEQQSVWERRNVDSAALRMVLARPLTGFGLDTFNQRNETYFRQPADYPLIAELRLGIHNVFLLFATELGLIGLTLFLASFAWAVGSALLAPVAPDVEAWRIGLIAVAVFWLVNANFAPIGHVFADTIVWLWAGVVLSGTLRRSPRLLR